MVTYSIVQLSGYPFNSASNVYWYNWATDDFEFKINYSQSVCDAHIKVSILDGNDTNWASKCGVNFTLYEPYAVSRGYVYIGKLPRCNGTITIKVDVHGKILCNLTGSIPPKLGTSEININVKHPTVTISTPEDHDENKKYSYLNDEFYFDVSVEGYGGIIQDIIIDNVKFYDINGNLLSTLHNNDGYTVSSISNGKRVNITQLPEYDGYVYVTASVKAFVSFTNRHDDKYGDKAYVTYIPDSDIYVESNHGDAITIQETIDLGEYPTDNSLRLYVCEYIDVISKCVVETDRRYYNYGDDEVEIRVNYESLSGDDIECEIYDNWPSEYKISEYTQSVNQYISRLNVDHLPPGQYNVYIKLETPEGVKPNISETEYKDEFWYNEYLYQTDDGDCVFTLTYPLFEDLNVSRIPVNSNTETPISNNHYSTELNEYGQCILKIHGINLQNDDRIIVRYKPYYSSASFFVGDAKPVSCIRTVQNSNNETLTYRLYVPFLNSTAEACSLADLYLNYLSNPSKIITTVNKWKHD